MSFSYLDWKIVENLKEGDITLHQISNYLLDRISYCIFPTFNTTLHILRDNPLIIKAIFMQGQKVIDNLKLDIPIIKDMEGKTFLHYMYGESKVSSLKLSLHFLKDYGIDHHSKQIADLIPYLTEMKEESFFEYLESRITDTQESRKYERGEIKAGDAIGASSLDLDNKEVGKILDKDSTKDTEIILNYIDMPYIHHYGNKNSELFFEKLSQTKDYKIFELKSIRKIISLKYKLIQKYMVMYELIPYSIYLLVFMIYTIFIH